MNTKTCKIVCFGDSTTAEGFSPSMKNQQANYTNLKVYSKWLQEKLPVHIYKNVKNTPL